MSQSHLHPPRLPTQSQQPNLSTGGDKPRTQTGADYRNQGVATWAPASSTSSSSHPTPEPPMFGAPPMFYDPAQSAQQQDQRGMADYDAWAESFAQGGQYANAGAAGYAQAGSVPHLEYGQQQQPMQGMAVPMDQGHGQYGYQQYAPDTHDPFNQAYSQQTPMNTSSDRPQRSLPRSSGRGGYASVTPPNMSSMPDGTAFSQQQQPHLNFPAQDEYLFHPQPSQAQPQAPARPGMQTRSSAPSVPTVDSIPQQRFQFAEYRHPDQLVAPAPVPSSYTATGSTPTSDINSFSSSPVSWGADQSQSEHTTSQTQSTTRKQGSATKPASQKTASAPDKGKKRARVPRDSDSSDDDEMGSFAINVSMAPSGGHGGPTRLPGACKHCKKLKMKCDFPKGDNTCRRCKAGGISCIVEGRKPRNAPK
ncbi:uncharacterized protein C8Q71DRAFT_479209 [Rhodofomes roseus]|uniref:Zn(2)-C6 fungal-type domain-containing protein n=1 Tax=Rhodofomes roseus TaxID=34475 RepID=A0ABQ8KPR3_9APHY|nr:uncharacterized protein C8Q71DRAFT_479209 [Rhodofomes roseus]KAH9840148.1 hypothetical protein C8Q71DRAFT_479209 [Rhodofomes roseus]